MDEIRSLGTTEATVTTIVTSGVLKNNKELLYHIGRNVLCPAQGAQITRET